MNWIERRAAEIVSAWEATDHPMIAYPKHISDGTARGYNVLGLTPAESAGWFMHLDDMTPASRYSWAGWLAREIARGK